MEASEQIAKIYRANDQYDSAIESIDIETKCFLAPLLPVDFNLPDG